jgi:hypothetical protein
VNVPVLQKYMHGPMWSSNNLVLLVSARVHSRIIAYSRQEWIIAYSRQVASAFSIENQVSLRHLYVHVFIVFFLRLIVLEETHGLNKIFAVKTTKPVIHSRSRYMAESQANFDAAK